MKIFKFGGSSIHNSEHIKNFGNIVLQHKDEQLIIVASAIDKTTNKLESLLQAYYSGGEYLPIWSNIKSFHFEILNQLLGENSSEAKESLEDIFKSLSELLEGNVEKGYDKPYDLIVGYGEILSTTLLNHYLKSINVEAKWMDIRDCLITDNTFREGNVMWLETTKLVSSAFDFSDSNLYITQGFIGATPLKQPTTLGREGSDYTAAILAYILNAESVTVWKDVEGVYTADPKQYNDYQKINKLSYYETVELSYFGAQVIHPKTIKPLENKKIPLFVKSFYQPEKSGTVITEESDIAIPPIIIKKSNQILVTISPKDFSFIVEVHISQIFSMLAKRAIKVNLFQHGAISISLVIDDKYRQFGPFVNELSGEFKVLFNSELTLITIRHYTEDKIKELTQGKKIFIEQRTRKSARYVIKDE